MKEIDLLNRRLGEALGFVLGGSQPRFKWVQAHECHYYTREHAGETFRTRCFADRPGTGKVWLLAQWRLPEVFDVRSNSTHVLTEAEWWQTFHGTMPYPARGHYIPHLETKLLPGRVPTAELTANYIFVLRQQMEANYQTQVLDGHTEMALDAKQWDTRFDEMTANAEPAFDHWNPGTRGEHVSFGGV